jgi:hypothetical protein
VFRSVRALRPPWRNSFFGPALSVSVDGADLLRTQNRLEGRHPALRSPFAHNLEKFAFRTNWASGPE